MTRDQAVQLQKGDIVIMDGDNDDFGVVLFNNGEVCKIDWALYKNDPSLHRVTDMDKIDRRAAVVTRQP